VLARRLGAVFLVLLIASLLGSCGDQPLAGEGSSGITGRAVLGPTCPVEREDTPCPDRPYAGARLRITERGTGDVAATVMAEDDGRFRVPLAPGEYVVDAEPTEGRPLPFAKPVDVTVRPGEFTHVTMSFESGIR
jgi:hypothetical protein